LLTIIVPLLPARLGARHFDLSYNCFHLAVDREQVGTLAVQILQECFTRSVDIGDCRQIDVNRPFAGGASPLPAISQFGYPRSREPSLELEGK
jgi:hypothetical protein